MTKFCGTKTCDECPWLKDQPAGRFPPERYMALLTTVGDEDAMRPIFACHKSEEGRDIACVGYILVEGLTNILVRLAAVRHHFDPKQLHATGELWESYRGMFAFNGVPREMIDEPRADLVAAEVQEVLDSLGQ